jgi:hypothetical protein
MSEEFPPDQPPSDSPQGGDAEFVSEKELDEVLAHASELANELSEEVGAPNGSADARGTPEEEARAAASPPGLDAELIELQQLVERTSRELDAAQDRPTRESTSSGDASARTAEPGPSANGYAVPDFMAEFTQSEEPPESGDSAPEASGEARQPSAASGAVEGERGRTQPEERPAPRPGVVGTGMIGVVGTPYPKLSDAEMPLVPLPDEQVDPETQASPVGGWGHRIRAGATLLSPIVLCVCARAVHLLEQIDRPFARLGHNVRRVIGWIAVATVGTSLFVYLFSLV